MMRKNILCVALATLLTLSAEAAGADFTVGSTSYPEGGKIPTKHGCGDHGGSDTSIQLAWKNAPAGTKSFAIIMDDPDAQTVVGYTWVHWNVFNVPATVTSVGETSNGKIEGAATTRNHFGNADYGGPCPPSGTHTYITAVYALDGNLDEPPNAVTRESFEKKFADRILAKAETQGDF